MAALAGCAMIASAVAGCGSDAYFWPLSSAEPTLIGPASLQSSRVGGASTLYEIDLEDGVALAVDGAIDAPGMSAVYDIGRVDEGDMLAVEVVAPGGGLDPAVGVFDDNDDSICINDDQSYYGGRQNSFAQFVARRTYAHCKVAVTSSPRSDTTGQFTLKLSRSSGASYTPPTGQIVYIDFEGHDNVVIGRRAPVDVPRFSGAMIDPQYEPYTAELKTLLLENVRRDYRGLNVEIIGSNEQPTPASLHTTVYMGSYNAALLGIADSVDAFNQNPAQNAIVFVDTFHAFAGLNPTVEELANALANVTSHEIGHLLGLNHTHDPNGIMDISASLRQMLTDQWFKRSPLNDDTFPVGYQDAVALLLMGIGGDPTIANAARLLRSVEVRIPWYDEGPRVPARSICRFGTACTGE